MSGNLYTATETLLRAYQSIIDENGISTISLTAGGEVEESKAGIPDRMEFYRQHFGGRKLTVAERLLSYVRRGGDEFATKQTDSTIAVEQEAKDQAAAEYIISYIKKSTKPPAIAIRELVDETRKEVETQVKHLTEVERRIGKDNSHNQKPLEPNEDNSQ